MLIQSEEHAQHVRPVSIAGVKTLVGVDGVVDAVLVDIDLGQSLHIGVVGGTQFGGFLEVSHRHRVLVQCSVIACQGEINLCGVGVDGQTVAVQVEGSVEVALLLLVDSLQVEILKPQGIVMREGRGCDSRRVGNAFLCHGFLMSATPKDHRQQHRCQHSHVEKDCSTQLLPHFTLVTCHLSLVTLLHARVAIATGTTFGLVQFLHHGKGSLLMACNHHLGNALAIVHYKVFARQVDE